MNARFGRALALVAVTFGGALGVNALAAPQVGIVLPLVRSAYQTNECIDVSVTRSAHEALSAGELVLTLSGEDGSRLAFTFDVPAVALKDPPKKDKKDDKKGDKKGDRKKDEQSSAKATEHYHLNGYLLRPGKYTLEAAVDGATAKTTIDVYSHLRQTDFRLINWGRAQSKDQLLQGENSFGYNLMYAHYGREGDDANFLRAGVDSMDNCVMSGAHQMDIRMECDWSDPYVTQGGTVRVTQRALQCRTRGNVPGVHFYDEPGLTWMKDPKTGESTPHAVPAQARSYKAAFGAAPISYTEVDPSKPTDVARWEQWARWKLGFMDAAWRDAQFGVRQVRPDYLSVTQSQYGFSAFTDGYYFNVARSLDVTSGHGGYDDFGPGYFNPSYTLEMARARDWFKPNWYLPSWYGNMPSDRFRAEQYLAFQTNIQGIMTPPDLEPAFNASARQGIVESNQLMKRLGGIFTTMDVTKPPVAMLYSLSQAIHAQALDRSRNYIHDLPQGKNLPLVYLAGKLIQQQFLPITEEDVLDGTLAADHRAMLVTSLDYLDPPVAAALESFTAAGGLVLLSADSSVKIKGAVTLGVAPVMPDQQKIDELSKDKKYNELAPYQTTGKFIEGASRYAQAVKAQLEKAGIRVLLESSVPTICVTRQAAGDIEYLFAVNATYDGAKNQKNDVAATVAKLSVPDDARPTYDAILGGAAPGLTKEDKSLAGTFRFGAGQMRVFARTARPVGGVRLATPTVHRHLMLAEQPIRLDLAATLVDASGGILAGSAPLHVRLIDPLGVTRYEFYRATRQGLWSISVPLAANDPPGPWKVIAQELLNGGEHTATFNYAPPPRAGAVAGATHRAVSFGNDLENAFRFARLFHQVTIVRGKTEFNKAAAERLESILKPWGIKSQIVEEGAAAKQRKLSDEEAATWIGLSPGQAKPGDNPPETAGYSVTGPVILLGNPEDNAIIKFLQERKFLPYSAKPDVFPGVGRGMVAWQRDGVGRGQESITLIAYDAEGLAEAVGTFYEAIAGIQPLTRWRLPARDAVSPATSAPHLRPVAPLAWSLSLPDRIDGLAVSGQGVTAIGHEGSCATITLDGKMVTCQPIEPSELASQAAQLASKAPSAEQVKTQSRDDRMLKFAATRDGRSAIAYWGGLLRVVDAKGKVQYHQQMPQDITAVDWLPNGPIVGLANGQILAFDAK